jgi:biopolymer transport protein ExbB/TolQ
LAVWLFFVGLLLFASLVIVWWAFGLVKEAKSLARDVKRAAGRLEEARADVSSEMDQAKARAEGIQKARRRNQRRRGEPTGV